MKLCIDAIDAHEAWHKLGLIVVRPADWLIEFAWQEDMERIGDKYRFWFVSEN